MTTLRAFPVLLLLASLAVAGCGGSVTPSSAAVVSPVAPSAATASGSIAPSDEPASVAPPTVDPSAIASAVSSAVASASASASAAAPATPKPTPKPGPLATIVFTGLKLDAKDDPNGKNRVITFDTKGTGTITVSVTTSSPQGTPILCLSQSGTRVGCKTAADGKVETTSAKRTEPFKVTLRGSGVETPVVDVTVSFPSRTPTVRVANFRFDGTDYPETNGFTATVTPRTDGNVTLLAAWGGHPFPYEVDLIEQGGSGSTTLPNQGPNVKTTVSLPILAPNPWRLTLQNIEAGFGTTPLTATIAWP